MICFLAVCFLFYEVSRDSKNSNLSPNKSEDSNSQSVNSQAETLEDILHTAKKMLAENSRHDLLKYLQEKSSLSLAQTNEIFASYLNIANRVPHDTNSEFQLELPKELYEIQLQQTNYIANNFVRFSNELTISAISNSIAPLGTWDFYEYPYVTNESAALYRVINRDDSIASSLNEISRLEPTLVQVYSRHSSPIILIIQSMNGSFNYYKKEVGNDSDTLPITKEESDALISQYFASNDQGFYGTFVPQIYIFFALSKFQKVNTSLETLFEQWKNRTINKIEYIPFSDGSLGEQYVLSRANNGDEKIFWYYTKDQGRYEYYLSREQWNSILETRSFREIRFFMNSDAKLNALSFRCDIDWNNTNLVNKSLIGTYPLQ